MCNGAMNVNTRILALAADRDIESGLSESIPRKHPKVGELCLSRAE